MSTLSHHTEVQVQVQWRSGRVQCKLLVRLCCEEDEVKSLVDVFEALRVDILQVKSWNGRSRGARSDVLCTLYYLRSTQTKWTNHFEAKVAGTGETASLTTVTRRSYPLFASNHWPRPWTALLVVQGKAQVDQTLPARFAGMAPSQLGC